MFDLIIREAAARFGLGDKAGPLVQMLLAYITNKDTGGISGFMSKLATGGLGDIVKSWLGGGASALPVSSSQIESLLGGQGGLLSSITSKLGIGGSTASSALGFLLPMVIGKLTPGGTVPTSLSSDVMGFITGGTSAITKGAAGAVGAVGAAGAAAGAATVAASKVVGSAGHAVGSAATAGVNTASAAGGGLMKWWPWLAVGLAALFLLSYCNKGGDAAKQAADGAKSAAATASASADSAAKATADAAAAAKALADKAAADAAAAANATADAAKAAAEAAMKAAPEAAPVGSGVVSYMADGMPALKVYFDSGKVAVASEFVAKSKDLVEFLKANATAKAVVSGFNDPTGNAAANAELSKNRAKGVAAAVKAAGIAEDRVLVEKPADPTAGAAKSNAEARRVEVTIRK